MVCAYCSGATSVINSRLQKRANRVWRRRKCSQCKSIFTTLEALDGQRAIMVSDTPNSKRPSFFSRDKLFISIYESCRHRKASVADASALTDTVVSKILRKPGPTVTKQAIKMAAYESLKRFDQAAAVYYKAYYCQE